VIVEETVASVTSPHFTVNIIVNYGAPPPRILARRILASFDYSANTVGYQHQTLIWLDQKLGVMVEGIVASMTTPHFSAKYI
jgi:hypothetical protein